jgi:hypothetical protein
MQDESSQDPRDVAIRAALRDAATLAAMVADEVTGSYRGTERALYAETLGTYLAHLGGALVGQEDDAVIVAFGGRRITVRLA